MNLRNIVCSNPSIDVREAVVTDLVEDSGRVVGITYKNRDGSLKVDLLEAGCFALGPFCLMLPCAEYLCAFDDRL